MHAHSGLQLHTQSGRLHYCGGLAACLLACLPACYMCCGTIHASTPQFSTAHLPCSYCLTAHLPCSCYLLVQDARVLRTNVIQMYAASMCTHMPGDLAQHINGFWARLDADAGRDEQTAQRERAIEFQVCVCVNAFSYSDTNQSQDSRQYLKHHDGCRQCRRKHLGGAIEGGRIMCALRHIEVCLLCCDVLFCAVH
jgi:hypothetical protein